MPRNSRAQATERRLSDAKAGENAEQFVDLQLDLVECRNVVVNDNDTATYEAGPVLLRTGGRWDRLYRRYQDSDAPKSRRLCYHEGQRDAAEWFAKWVTQWTAIRRGELKIPSKERIYSVILSGGQRAGKTRLAVTMGVHFALLCPGSIVWLCAPASPRFKELKDALREIMPKGWYVRRGSPFWTYDLPNGSQIVLKSAYDPGNLKDGDCDFAVLNEGQLCDEEAWNTLRLRIGRSGALAVLCANPPRKAKGMWVANRISDAEQGRIRAKHFHIDPDLNPFIDKGPMEAFRAEVDQRTYDIEVRGLILVPDAATFYNWERLKNEKAPPARIFDVTRRFLEKRHGYGFDSVIGVDVQKRPMVGIEYRWFLNPRIPMDHEDWAEYQYAWVVREFVLDWADEEALAAAWLEAGVDPERTLIVCDATARKQRAERDPKKLATAKIKGKGSWDVFRKLGFHHIVGPQKNSDANPDVVERFRIATSRICRGAPTPWGRRFLYIDPRCRQSLKAMREYATKHGMPDRRHPMAHVSDGITYPLSLFYERKYIPKGPTIRVYPAQSWDEYSSNNDGGFMSGSGY